MNARSRMLASLSAIALALVLAGGAKAVTRTAAPAIQETTVASAEDMYPDAPYGVDPMVTGPVSTAFKTQQAEAGCATARWPDIPAVCYPQ